MKNQLQVIVAPELADAETIKLREEFIMDIGGRRQVEIVEKLVDLRQRAIRDSLIALGWTPPKGSGR